MKLILLVVGVLLLYLGLTGRAGPFWEELKKV